VGKFATSSERPKAKSVSALGGFVSWPPDQGLCGSAPEPNWGLCPQTPYYRGLTLVFGGLQLFNAGTADATPAQKCRK